MRTAASATAVLAVPYAAVGPSSTHARPAAPGVVTVAAIVAPDQPMAPALAAPIVGGEAGVVSVTIGDAAVPTAFCATRRTL